MGFLCPQDARSTTRRESCSVRILFPSQSPITIRPLIKNRQTLTEFTKHVSEIESNQPVALAHSLPLHTAHVATARRVNAREICLRRSHHS
jgi:hypothetical protein